MPRSFRHNLYLSLPVSKNLAQASASPGVSQSAVVEAALKQFFDPEQKPQAVLVRRLDHQGRAIERQLHHTELVLEALALFVQSYFNVVPPMAPGALEAQKALGAKRFDAFISELGRRMATGHSLASDIFKSEPLSQPPANDAVHQTTDTESPHAA
jgi:hypothetical protein